ncbi:MAG: hypothetical protein CMJ58_18140 [Planctomycetaceae bacterium]|nr:hypothetical protein [Planctomycetaceae bacterium]
MILLVVTVLQRSVGFGRGILFCRWLPQEALGQWEMAYSFLLLAAPLAVLGVPGSFGRYAEYYRQRGHLRTFLNRAMIWTAACGAIAAVAVAAVPRPFSLFIFGDDSGVQLVRGMSLCLAAIIFHHTLTSLLTALRLYRVVSAMNMAQSMLFAVISLALLWRAPRVEWIVSAYGIASLLSGLGALAWAWPGLRGIEPAVESLPQREFWPRLLRFAFFLWVSNLLAHLFGIVDRYMLLHWSGMEPSVALEQVGNYHSSRIVPLLLVSVADLLSGLIMPHLSHDWEAGRRDLVSQRMGLAIKLAAASMLAFGICVLVGGPFLFDEILQGRYGAGLAILPWTLAGCVWYAVLTISQNYLWCAERARQSTFPLATGLVVNTVLNAILVPTWGLKGAVVATALATLCGLAVGLLLNRVHGMTVDRRLWIAAIAPGALALGAWPALAALALLLVPLPGGSVLLTSDEWTSLTNLAQSALAKLRSRLPRRPAVTSP